MTRPQAAKPFDPRHGASRRKEWSTPEPYRTYGVILAPRRALAGIRKQTRQQQIKGEQ
jgi:hypothetical protein